MPAYYSKEMLQEMEDIGREARERIAAWMATQTANNMKHLGKEVEVEPLTIAYQKSLEEDL